MASSPLDPRFQDDFSRERMPPVRVLIISEEKTVTRILRKIALQLSFIALVARSRPESRRILKEQTVDLVLVDLDMSAEQGPAVFEEIRRLHPETDMIVTAMRSKNNFVLDALKGGATAFLDKPLNEGRIKGALDQAKRSRIAEIRIRRSHQRLGAKHDTATIIGTSTAMQDLRIEIDRAAKSTDPILILGEHGSGKELVARALHFSSTNHLAPFIRIDCKVHQHI
jgi:DNA-binding NtrC family response regulator